MYREDTTTPLPPDRSVLVIGINGTVFGVDRTNGAVRWQNVLPGGSYGEVFIAVGYGVVIASAHGGVVFCLDYLTGAERWKVPTSASGRASIVIEPDCIICAKGGYVDCFTTDGRVQWNQPLSGAPRSSWSAGTERVALGFPGNFAQADESGA